jgi:hypothetical protein
MVILERQAKGEPVTRGCNSEQVCKLMVTQAQLQILTYSILPFTRHAETQIARISNLSTFSRPRQGSVRTWTVYKGTGSKTLPSIEPRAPSTAVTASVTFRSSERLEASLDQQSPSEETKTGTRETRQRAKQLHWIPGSAARLCSQAG